MNRKKAAERWEHESLRWIHEVRAKIYKREKGVPLTEFEPGLSPDAEAIVQRLGLKRVFPSELRQTTSARTRRRKSRR